MQRAKLSDVNTGTAKHSGGLANASAPLSEWIIGARLFIGVEASSRLRVYTQMQIARNDLDPVAHSLIVHKGHHA
jgi:hypothetical protein